MSDAPKHLLNCTSDMDLTALKTADKFLLKCTGYEGTVLGENPHFIFPSEQFEYSLHLLNVDKADNGELHLMITGYKPGDYRNVQVGITDGITVYTTNPLSWKVNSVLKQGEMPMMYSSVGPLDMRYPIWFWLVIAVLLFAVFGVVMRFVMKRIRRKKLLAELNKYQTMLSPFNQFSKDMRTVLRHVQSAKSDRDAVEIFNRLDEDFRLYLVRELKVPALEFDRKEILNEIKVSHRRLYTTHRAELEKVLLELENAKEDIDKIHLQDCEQLYHATRKLGEKIYEFRRKVK